MTNRFPLIFNGDSDQIQELAADDNLDLQGSGIRNGVGAQFTGVVTATTFDGNATTSTTASNLTGTPQVTVSTITGVAATFTGSVSIGGTLTYEDVTNVDSVGLITARSGINVTSGNSDFGDFSTFGTRIKPSNGIGIKADGATAREVFHVTDSTDSSTKIQFLAGGDAIFQGRVSVAQTIAHAGDTNTNFGFPAADTFAVTTNGTERLRITSDGIVSVANTTNVNFSGAASGSTTEVLRLDNANNDSNDNLTTRIAYRRSGNSGTNLYTTLDSVRTGTHDTDFVISNNVATVLTERLRISAQGTFKFNNGALIEHGDTLTAARNGTQTIDLASGMVIRCSTASAGTWKPNFRVDSNISLNTAMNDNDIISPTMIVAKGATTHFANAIQIDGSDVTPEFLGGAPTDGGGSGTFDIYSYTIMKTGDATFSVFASVSTFE